MRNVSRFTLLLLAITLVACSPEKNKDHVAMNAIPMHAVCVGRMLVDLPQGGNFDWKQQFDLAKVERLPHSINTTEEFWAYVQNRKTRLEQPADANPDGRIFKYEKLDSDHVVIQFRPEHVNDSYIHTERYLWVAYEGYEFKTGTLSDAKAFELLSRIKGTQDNLSAINNFHPISEPGFCIDGAVVAGKIGPIWASTTTTIKGWPGVFTNVLARENDGSRPKPSWQQSSHTPKMRTAFQQLDGIKEWVAASEKSDADDRVVSFQVLRRRDQSLAEMDGQEIAVKIKLANGQEWYRFEWHSLSDDSRTDNSGFSVFLEAGDKQYTANYTPPPPQQDLLALWDAMLASLKRRPGAG